MKATILIIIVLISILTICLPMASASDSMIPSIQTNGDLLTRLSDTAVPKIVSSVRVDPASAGVGATVQQATVTGTETDQNTQTSAPAPAIQWQKCLGGTDWDEAYSIQQTSDGGYIVAGAAGSSNGLVTKPHGNYDYWVVKLTSTGIVTWEKSIGGSYEDQARSVQQTSDGGYIVIGYSGSSDGEMPGSGWKIWLVKLTSAGEISWMKPYKFDIPGSINLPHAFDGQQTSDGGYIVAGELGNSGYSSSFVIIRFNANGDFSWRQVLGGGPGDGARSVRQTTDGGFIVAGQSSGTAGDVLGHHGLADYRIVKLTSTGSVEWQKCLGGTNDEVAYGVQQTSEGGYIVAGWSKSKDGDVKANYGREDFWVVKLTTTGEITWAKNYGGGGSDAAYSIQQTSDGGYIVAGISGSEDGDVTNLHGYTDYWILKLTSSGGIQWQKCLGGYYYDWANSIRQTSDGGYIVAGNSESTSGDVNGHYGGKDYWVVKLAGAEPSPTIRGITPAIGYPTANWPVTITGTNFRDGVVVQISKGGVKKKATIQSRTSTRITAILPTLGIATGKYSLIITNTDTSSVTKPNAFTVKAPGPRPTIKKISPNSGLLSKNTKVTITGTNFRNGAIVQMISGTKTKPASITSCAATRIVCILPTRGAKAGLWNVKVINADMTSVTKTRAFTVKRTTSAATEVKAGQESGIVLNTQSSQPLSVVPSRGSTLSGGMHVPVTAQIVSAGIPGVK